MRTGRLVIAVVAMTCLVAGCATATRDGSSEPGGVAMDGEQAVVLHVVDGDTFDVELSGGSTERVRLPQIDAPELDECGYAESSAALEELVWGETVRLAQTESGPGRDDHGRLLRATWLVGKDVGLLLVRDGLARWLSRYADEDSRLAQMYEQAERQARDEGAGLWSACGWH
ncbi:MAG TPA: thermonuclease family protein [Jiangellaceae bacterium]